MTYFKAQVHVIKSDDLQQREHNQNTRFQSAILLGDALTALLESAQKAVYIAFREDVSVTYSRGPMEGLQYGIWFW